MITIRVPRWTKRTVGIGGYRLAEHNQIEITKTDKDGNRYYPDQYYISGERARTYPTQELPSGILLFLIPISDLEILEFTDE